MRTSLALCLFIGTLSLGGCSSVSVESQVRPDAGSRTAARTLVVVSLPDESRRGAEDSLVTRLASLHPSASYESVRLEKGLTLGALRDRARKDGFDRLLVVWPTGIDVKRFPDVNPENFGIPSSSQLTIRFAASLTVLDGDREVWKGLAMDRNASERTPADTMAALAKRLHADGVAN